MPSIPTVAIANDDGSDYVVINQSDYAPEIHQLWDNSEPDAQAVADQPAVDAPDQDTELTARAKELADSKTMAELKAMAKELGISGYSKMNQSDITMAIAEAEATGDG